MATKILPQRRVIRELPLSERPAARLEAYGARSLSNVELVALLLSLESLDDAQELLVQVGGLPGLLRHSSAELIGLAPGIGKASAQRLAAGIEFGRRIMHYEALDRVQIKSPSTAANLIAAHIGEEDQEHLITVLLDTKNRVQRVVTVYIGSVNASMVRVGEVFKAALKLNSPAIIIAHNHPSGDPTPSPEDTLVTRQIVDAGKLLDVDVLDHIIVATGGKFVSMRERGLGFGR